MLDREVVVPSRKAHEVRPGDRVRVGNGAEVVTRRRVVMLGDRAVVHFVHEESGRKVEWSEYVESDVEVEPRTLPEPPD